MKIVGYQAKGNVIRFYLGSDDINPKYPSNSMFVNSSSLTISAEPAILKHPLKAPGIYPFSDFVVGYKDYVVGWNKTAFINKFADLDNLKKGIDPLVVIINSEYENSYDGFVKYKGAQTAYRFYLFDEMEPDEIGLPEGYPEKSIGD